MAVVCVNVCGGVRVGVCAEGTVAGELPRIANSGSRKSRKAPVR